MTRGWWKSERIGIIDLDSTQKDNIRRALDASGI